MARFAVTLAVVGAVLTGCARLCYEKVPTPTQYRSWSDAQQRDADAMEGVRYYLPRPFLHLKKSTPVGQRAAFVSFTLDKAGRYELQVPTDAPSWVKRVAPPYLSITQALAAITAGAQLQKGELAAEEKKPEAAEETKPSELFARTGYVNVTDPVTALSDRMDVVYLPDFEEQYVITVSGGLGSVDVETKLRNGWAAEVFHQKVDNSRLIPYVIDQVERASKATAGILMNFASPVPGATAGAASLLAQLQSGKIQPRQAAEALGGLLVFRLVEVRTAQPGLYPILKPREIHHILARSGENGGPPDLSASFAIFLRKANLPWIRPEVAFVPCPPFTMIGFNATTDVLLLPASAAPGTEAPAKKPGGNGQDDKDPAKRIARAAQIILDIVKKELGGDGWGKVPRQRGYFIYRPVNPEELQTLETSLQRLTTLPTELGSAAGISIKKDDGKVGLLIPNVLLEKLANAAENNTWPRRID